MVLYSHTFAKLNTIKLTFVIFFIAICITISKSQSNKIKILEKQINESPKKTIKEVRNLLFLNLEEKNSDLYFYLGKSFRILGQLDSAAYYMYKSLSNEPLLSDEQKIKYYTELGVVLKQQYKTSIALPYYQKALILSEKTADKKSYSKLLNNLGRVHFELRNYPEAEYIYRRALALNTPDQIRSNAILYHNLAAIFEKRNDLDSAVHFYKIALDGYKSIKDKILIAYGYCSLARIETDPTVAFELIDKSIKIRKELGLMADLEESMLVKAQLLLNQNNSIKALFVVDSTEYMVHKTGHPNILMQVYKLKSEILSKLGNYYNAYTYQRKYIELIDKEIDDETIRLITGFTNELKFKQTIRELAFMHKQDSLQQGVINAKIEALGLKEKQNYLFKIILFFVLGVALVLIFLLQKLNNKNKKLKLQGIDLQKSNEEKEMLLKEVNHRVKNNLQIALSIIRRGLDNIIDPEARQIIFDNIHSVETVAMIHETIYNQGQLNSIDLHTYVENLAGKTLMSLDNNKEFQLTVYPFNAKINADTAIYLGQFVCEWVLNAMKHAQPTENSINLEVGHVEEAGDCYIYFRDNGKNPDKNIFLNSSQFGNKLMRSTVKKICGQELLVNDENGFELKIYCNSWHEKK